MEFKATGRISLPSRVGRKPADQVGGPGAKPHLTSLGPFGALVALKANFRTRLLALRCRDDAGHRVPLALGDLDSPTGRWRRLCAASVGPTSRSSCRTGEG